MRRMRTTRMYVPRGSRLSSMTRPRDDVEALYLIPDPVLDARMRDVAITVRGTHWPSQIDHTVTDHQ